MTDREYRRQRAERAKELQLKLAFMVDEQGMTIPEAARELKIAPQPAGSLYCRAKLEKRA